MSVITAGTAPDFLLAKLGDIVVVEEDSPVSGASKADWWVGHIIHIVGGARDPRSSSLFQVACVDTGMIRMVNADVVKGILRRKNLAP